MAQPLEDDQFDLDNIWLPDASLPEVDHAQSWNDETWQEWLSIGNLAGSDNSTISSGPSLGGSPDVSQWTLDQDVWHENIDDPLSPYPLLNQSPMDDLGIDLLYGKNDLILGASLSKVTDTVDSSHFDTPGLNPVSIPCADTRIKDAADNSLEAWLVSALSSEGQIEQQSSSIKPLAHSQHDTNATNALMPKPPTRKSNDGPNDGTDVVRTEHSSRRQRTKRKRRTKHEMQMSDEAPPGSKALPHAVIEERYRKKLIDTFAELREMCKDVPGLGEARKNNKAAVMGRAAEYIRHLEKKNKTISDELARWKKRYHAKQDSRPEARSERACHHT